MDIPVRHLPHDGQECPSYTHPEILQPLEHTTVRVKVELTEPVPEGMVGTLHLAWYDPDNTLGNEPSTPPAHNGHGRRDNFLVAAHPNQNIVTQYEFRENDAQDVVLMYQENTGLWAELPDDPEQGDFRTSILTILPSVDIDCDSDNTATPTWHGIDRSDWEEYIENEAEYPGKIVEYNNNDDNNNGIAHYLENADFDYPPSKGWVPFPDPDLVPVVLGPDQARNAPLDHAGYRDPEQPWRRLGGRASRNPLKCPRRWKLSLLPGVHSHGFSGDHIDQYVDRDGALSFGPRRSDAGHRESTARLTDSSERGRPVARGGPARRPRRWLAGSSARRTIARLPDSGSCRPGLPAGPAA
jgi:hypothetical protein